MREMGGARVKHDRGKRGSFKGPRSLVRLPEAAYTLQIFSVFVQHTPKKITLVLRKYYPSSHGGQENKIKILSHLFFSHL